MKTKKLGPPQYPYPIQICVGRGEGWWKRVVCGIFGHEQCGLHWEQNDPKCCRCSKEGDE